MWGGQKASSLLQQGNIRPLVFGPQPKANSIPSPLQTLESGFLVRVRARDIPFPLVLRIFSVGLPSITLIVSWKGIEMDYPALCTPPLTEQMVNRPSQSRSLQMPQETPVHFPHFCVWVLDAISPHPVGEAGSAREYSPAFSNTVGRSLATELRNWWLTSKRMSHTPPVALKQPGLSWHPIPAIHSLINKHHRARLPLAWQGGSIS